LFAAYREGVRVGGAAIVRSATEVELLDERQDLALLWDLRVAPDMRRRGVGIALLQAIERWARDQDAGWLKVETQDLNVPACRFYLRNGFQLRAVRANAYPGLPHEKQLLWYKRLTIAR
jgi:GNAT superfamily N-acetyltransferase